MAGDRSAADEALAGDIIGLHNHGTINIGDTFTEGEKLAFTGIPNFAPEMFRRAVLKDPLKMKALAKGLGQLCEEGATQLFRPRAQQRADPRGSGAAAVRGGGVPAAGRIQRAVRIRGHRRAYRALGAAATDERKLAEFRNKAYDNLAVDHSGALVYLAPSRVNLALTLERWPDLRFRETRESQA